MAAAKFKVPEAYAPGVFRQGVKFYKVGQVMALPDAASPSDEVVPLKLIPLNKEAEAMLVESAARLKKQREEAAKKREDEAKGVYLAEIPADAEDILEAHEKAEKEKAADVVGVSVRQLAAEQAGVGEKPAKPAKPAASDKPKP